MSVPLCLACGSVSEYEIGNSPALQRLRDWQDRVSLFWGQRPMLYRLLSSSLIWIALAILFAFKPDHREIVPVFVVLFTLLIVAFNWFPLTPLPIQAYTVVTSREDAYSTAAISVILVAMVIAFAGVFVITAEKTGSVVFHMKTGYDSDVPSPINFWSTSAIPWLSTFLLVAPPIYFASLIVSRKSTNFAF